MIETKDLEVLKNKGISEEKLQQQIQHFREGFPFMKLVKPALIDDGIIRLDELHLQESISRYQARRNELRITKFIPASGAASRMFKQLYEFSTQYKGTDADYQNLKSETDSDSMYYFFKNLDKFAFWPKLKAIFQRKNKSMEEELLKKQFVSIVDAILDEDGLNYGNLPKGLLDFHTYDAKSRTAFEEHLVEASLYAVSHNKANLHFTVSPEHQQLFEELLQTVKVEFEKELATRYQVSFSTQKPETDTVAVNPDNSPFRDSNEEIVFRPGGHGALIENLNEIDSDLVFIKNIDNVVPDSLKQPTTDYKQALAGLLLFFKDRIFGYLNRLEQIETVDDALMDEIGCFLQQNLCILPSPNFKARNRLERIKYLYEKLNRPIRVCGMVKNEGEPGGGPFWAENSDGTASLQIVEASQLDMSDKTTHEIVEQSTHFNPVDLVCYVIDYEGNKFDLREYTDPATGFIANKSKDGRELKALELPGLWNGAMSDWNTIFMEVPIETFAPVKTINDLLRPQHQNSEIEE